MVPGSTTRGFAALPIATTTVRTLATTSTVFELFVLPPGLFCSPFLYSTLALLSFFFSLSFLGAKRLKIFGAQALASPA